MHMERDGLVDSLLGHPGVACVAVMRGGGPVVAKSRRPEVGEPLARSVLGMLDGLPLRSGEDVEDGIGREVEVQTAGYRCHAVTSEGGISVAVAIEMGNPVTKSLRRMVRRALRADARRRRGPWG